MTVLLSGCQSWSTVEFDVPRGREVDVRAKIREASLTAGLLPCSHWKIRVRNSEECYGGQFGANRVTVITESGSQSYMVKLGVYSSGQYDKPGLHALELRYQSALQQLFPEESITSARSFKLLEVEPV
jgi:hypothetical protein